MQLAGQGDVGLFIEPCLDFQEDRYFLTVACGIHQGIDNIEIVSIIDRFLEHSRVFIFCNNNDNKYYTGSADWMPRNLDHRIEVITPILDKDIRKELWDMLQIQLGDNCKARKSSEENINYYKETGTDEQTRSQFDTYEYFRLKTVKTIHAS